MNAQEVSKEELEGTETQMKVMMIHQNQDHGEEDMKKEICKAGQISREKIGLLVQM